MIARLLLPLTLAAGCQKVFVIPDAPALPGAAEVPELPTPEAEDPTAKVRTAVRLDAAGGPPGLDAEDRIAILPVERASSRRASGMVEALLRQRR